MYDIPGINIICTCLLLILFIIFWIYLAKKLSNNMSKDIDEVNKEIENELYYKLNRIDLYKNYETIMVMFHLGLDKSFSRIKREFLISHIVNQVKVGQDDSIRYLNRFIELLPLYCGTSVMKDYADLLGDMDSVIMIAGDYFIEKTTELELEIKSINNNDISSSPYNRGGINDRQ